MPGGYFDDMIAQALDELNTRIRDAYQLIKTRVAAA